MADKNHIKEVKTAIPEMKSVEVYSGRKKLLELTDALIEETFNRISGERFRLREGDRERLAYLRTLIGLIALYDALLKGSQAPALEGLSREEIEARTRKGENNGRPSSTFNGYPKFLESLKSNEFIHSSAKSQAKLLVGYL